MARWVAQRFELIDDLGSGGASGRAAYRARDAQLGGEVVLVRVPLADDRAGAALRREVDARAGLDDPGVVPLVASGTHDEGTAYLAFATVEGARPLRSVWAERRSVEDRARLVGEAARAVGAAHAAGVVHRDLRPETVVVDLAGRVRVLERGAGGVVAPGDDPPAGAPAVRPPEQEAAAAADVAALGALLYEALTDRVPWDEAPETARRRPRRPRRIDPRVPPPLEAVCLKALARDPTERYPDASALADDVRAALDGRSVTAPSPDGPAGGRRLVWAGAAAGLLALALGAAGLLAAAPQEPPAGGGTAGAAEGPEETPSATARPRIGWRLEAGDVLASRLHWRRDTAWEGADDSLVEIVVDLEERVRHVRRGLVTIDAEVSGLEVHLRHALDVDFDSEDPSSSPLPLGRIVGAGFTLRYSVETGEVRHVLGLDRAREGISTAAMRGPLQGLADEMLGFFNDDEFRQNFETLLRLLPASGPGERADWRLEKTLWPGKTLWVETTQALRRGAEPGSLAGTFEGPRVTKEPRATSVSEGSVAGTSRAVFADGRLRESSLRLTYRIQESGRRGDVTWRLSYQLRRGE